MTTRYNLLHMLKERAGAFDACQRITREQLPTLHAALSLLPPHKARPAWALCALYLRACEAAGKCLPQGLDLLEGQLTALRHGSRMDDPVSLAMEAVLSQLPDDLRTLYDMIDGQRMAMRPARLLTQRELDGYCYHTGGTFALLMLPLVCATPRALHRQAAGLGMAMRMTDMLCGIGEDLDRGRVYLPQDLMAACGYAQADLRDRRVSDAFIRLWETLARHAEGMYDTFERAVPMLDEDSRVGILLAMRQRRAGLYAVRAADYRCLEGPPCQVGAPHRRAILGDILLECGYNAVWRHVATALVQAYI